MHRRVIVSGSGRIRAYAWPEWTLENSAPLSGAGALLLAGEALYCASDEESAIFRLDARTLLPTGVFAGGPGMRALCASGDGRRLYALVSDADSVLMLDRACGAPLMLARVGVNPQSMRYDDASQRLIIAGGEDGCTYLLSGGALDTLERLAAPGICWDAACCGDRVQALTMTQALDSELHTWDAGRNRRTLRLPGLPGVLAAHREQCLAAVQEGLYAVSPDGARMLVGRPAPGRAGKLLFSGESTLLLDSLSDALYASDGRGGIWRRVCTGVKDAVMM